VRQSNVVPFGLDVGVANDVEQDLRREGGFNYFGQEIYLEDNKD
jgi:hypothetical protein